MEAQTCSRTNVNLNLVRVVAIAAVILLHASAGFAAIFDLGTPEFLWGNFFHSLSRIGVPLFVMTSGALMLNEEKPFSLKKLFSGNILPMVILLVVWSALYAVGFQILIPALQGERIRLSSIIEAFLLGHYHLWYLYMQIGLYLALPLLRRIVSKANKNLVLLYIAISLLTQFTVPLIRSAALQWEGAGVLLSFLDKFHLGFFNVFVCYYLTGWYLVHIGVPEKGKRLAFYGVALLAVIVTMVYVAMTKDSKNACANDNLIIYLYSAGVFLALNNMIISPQIEPAISLLAKCSFGMFAIHPVFLSVLTAVLPLTIPTPVYILLTFVLIGALSCLATYVLSKVPLAKKLVRM